MATVAFGAATQVWAVQSIILTNSNSTSTAARAANYLYSPGLGDILKMEKAQVDPEVIKAYIKASPVPYNPSAAEVIALKNAGVPPDVITALLQRGAELRTQMAQAPTAAPGQGQYPGAAAPTAGMPSPYDYGAGYAPNYADYGYGYPPYGYGYPPTYWWSSSFWPWYSYGPGFGFDFFDHHHRDFRHFRDARFQNDDFNRFRNPRFQNFDFNRFNTARNFSPWSQVGFNRFNQFNNNGAFSPVVNGARSANVVPRAGMTVFGVPSRAYAPGAFAGGSASAAFIGRPPAAGFGPVGARVSGSGGPRMGGGFAVRSFGGGMRGGGGGHGGGGGGGHR